MNSLSTIVANGVLRSGCYREHFLMMIVFRLSMNESIIGLLEVD